MENLSHWESARKVANEFDPRTSVVYAADHLEALLLTRKLVRPEEMSADEWENYKEDTAALGMMIESVKTLRV